MSTAIALSLEKKKNSEPKRYTLEQYLAREERSKQKHEYYNGEIIPMPGAKINHNRIASNILHYTRSACKNLKQKIEVFGEGQKIYVLSTDSVFYPDAIVICEKVETLEGQEEILITNPRVIVEVASRSTSKYDRDKKFKAYRTIPSFKEYIIIQQDYSEVETWFRERETTWDIKTETDLTKNILLRSLGVEIALSDIYENVAF